MKKITAIFFALCLTVVMTVSASAALIPINSDTFAKNGGGLLSFRAEDQVINFSYTEGVQTVWAAIESGKAFDISNGFKITISDIKWDSEANTALTVIVSDRVNDRAWITSKHGVSLTVEKDGTVKFWGIGESNYWGNSTNYDEKVLEKNVKSFTYSLVPNTDKTAYVFYINDTAIATFDQGNKAGWPGMLQSLDAKYFGFGVLDGDKHDNLNVPGSLNFRLSCIGTPESLTVNGKDSSVFSGDTVNVEAPAAPEGKVFGSWTAEGIDLGKNSKLAKMSFVMPSGAVKLTANYVDGSVNPPDTGDEIAIICALTCLCAAAAVIAKKRR